MHILMLYAVAWSFLIVDISIRVSPLSHLFYCE